MKTKQTIYGIHAVSALLETQASDIITLYVQQGRLDRKLKSILNLAKRARVTVCELSRDELAAMVDATTHQGVIALCEGSKPWCEQDLFELLAKLSHEPLLLILDGVQDPHNLGACLRTANAARVDAVIIPQDRAASLTPTVRKVACGAAELTPVVQVTNLSRTLRALKEQGIWCYGLDAQGPVTLYETTLKGPLAIVMGSEGQGMRRLTKEQCDQLLAIPLHGQVSSLNVSVATGITLFECQRQRL